MSRFSFNVILPVLFLLGASRQILFAQTTPDPGLPGTYSVVKAEYNLGDLAWKPPSFADSVEMRGSVHYPSALSAGPFPVLLFLHGRHETCYDTTNPANTSNSWPCTGKYKSIVSYEGYDYVAHTMASHGYIVISISCNAINATDNSSSDYGMQGRGELMQHHLDLWNTYNTTGAAPFGTTFVGKLDMQNIGTMGHSRGGEGAVFNALYNQSLGSPYGIKAVLTLAPVDFLRHVLHGIPLMNVAPYCDGDVNRLSGVHFYDDARYTDTTDNAPKHSVVFMGANHNFFNTVWTPGSYIAGGVDDWLYTGSATASQCGVSAAARFDTTKQKAAFNAYAVAFYRVYIGHETKFTPILDVEDVVPPASSLLDSSNVFMSYHPAKADRRDINRTDDLATDTINTLSGSVTVSGLVSSQICGGGVTEPSCGVVTYSAQRPHDGSTTVAGLSQMGMQWNDSTDWYQNEIPLADQNLAAYQNLLFRAAVNFHTSPAGVHLDFTVQLIDSAGAVSNEVISNYSHALFFQPGNTTGDLPKVLFNTISIPISSFIGINKAKIKYVKFLFNKSALGAIFISDLSFTNPLCGNSTALFNYSFSTHYHVSFTNATVANTGDSLSWKWIFGDPTTGANDTSLLQNTNHIYSGQGTFHPCLYVTSYRKNGLKCIDSFCSTFVLANEGISELNTSPINIFPNPANDHLYITGAESTDLFKLVNLLGQEVFTAPVSASAMYLPTNIANGVYYGIVITQQGRRVYRKLLIMR